MAYRIPAVRVTQLFAAAAGAIAAPTLPSCSIGPAFQLLDDDLLGTYTGSEQIYSYAGIIPGSKVDIAPEVEDDPFPIMSKPISVELWNVVLEMVSEASTGAVDGTTFSDATPDIFLNVQQGDKVVIVPQVGVSIVPAKTDGGATTANPERLTSPNAGEFANVKVGDTVDVTGGTNAITGSFSVVAKVNGQLLILDGAINDGGLDSTDINYSITGDRGEEGEHAIIQKVDDNTLVLAGPLGTEAPLTYYIKRELTGQQIPVERVETFPNNGFLADEAGVTLPVNYLVEQAQGDFPVLESNVYASYRSLRTDLASEVRNYQSITDIEAIFGPGQIQPANPLAYALSKMKENTVSSVNGLALSADYYQDETLAYTKAADVLVSTDMYALAPLTQLGTVHALFANHVTQMSTPDRSAWRVAIINSPLSVIGSVVDAAEIDDSLVGSRAIVTTQVAGSGDVINPDVLLDVIPDQFLNVAPGDQVTIVSGTGVVPGTYGVASVQSSNEITLDGAFITAGTPADVQYYIQRQDGLGADGQTLYDRNASFLSDGVAAGHFVRFSEGLTGRFQIGEVISEKEVKLASPYLGVTELTTGFTYEVDRDLSKTEQASNVAGYSSAFANRRVVHIWPDVLQAPVGQQVEDLPGYFMGAVIAALTTGLPSHQGFTNLVLGGFTGSKNGVRYFSEDQLNVIAGGGSFIVVNDGENQPLYGRHQLTTDLSTIKFQEYSVTKNVDFISRVLLNQYKPHIGLWNITDTTLDQLKTTAEAVIKFLRDGTRFEKIGGSIRSGALQELVEDETQIDTVRAKFGFRIPIPLNHIDITIEV